MDKVKKRKFLLVMEKSASSNNFLFSNLGAWTGELKSKILHGDEQVESEGMRETSLRRGKNQNITDDYRGRPPQKRRWLACPFKKEYSFMEKKH